MGFVFEANEGALQRNSHDPQRPFTGDRLMAQCKRHQTTPFYLRTHFLDYHIQLSKTTIRFLRPLNRDGTPRN